MILGIDASNIRIGGGVTHLVELLRAADPLAHGFSQVIVWSGKRTLDAMDDRPWLVKVHVPVLDAGLTGRMLWQRFRLSRLARAAGCDLLFVPGGSYAGSFRPIAAMSQNLLPFEWNELRRYGWSWMTVKQSLLRHTQSSTFRRAEGVLFLTDYARDAVVKVTGALRGRTAVVPHGIRDAFTCPPREQEPLANYAPARPFRLLYISTIEVYKHQWHVADAVAMLRREGMPVVLDLIGPAYPPALARLKRTLAAVDPEGAGIRYLGAVPYGQMPLHYGRADAAVFASTCETFGQTVTEAMSAGLPLACSNRSAMRELLGNAAAYFDPEQPRDIAAALARLIESPELRARNAQAAFTMVRRYSWTRCADETFAFLRESIPAHESSRRTDARARGRQDNVAHMGRRGRKS